MRQSHAALIMASALMALAWFNPASAQTEKKNLIFYGGETELLEYRAHDGEDIFVFEADAWIGGDDNQFELRSEGTYLAEAHEFEELELQALYQRRISDFFDAEIGIRHDFRPLPARTYGVLGLHGLAPQWFEVDGALFLSEEGNVSFRFESEYDILFSQDIVLQPKFETNIALSDDSEIGVGNGVNDIELGLRLRYHITRDIAPYIGVNWEWLFGQTADLATEEGEDTNVVSFVVGLRLSF